MKKLVVLSGSGLSAESGIQTFRDMGGLWEQYDVTEVASPVAWQNDPELVMKFYNWRRKKLFEAEPNAGHFGLASLDNYFDVDIVTQNVDDLHERAGSKNILHLHGELKKARSTADPELIYELDHWELKLGDKCEKGSQLRPHIVWFGESVPAIEDAARIAATAEIFVIVGTSLNVYPAASLIHYVPRGAKIYLIDPGDVTAGSGGPVEYIQEKATVGVQTLTDMLKEEYPDSFK